MKQLQEIIDICESVKDGDLYLEESVIRDIYYLTREIQREINKKTEEEKIMGQEKYYIALIEEYTNPLDESPFRTVQGGLFKTYRDASEWLIDEGLDVYTIPNPFSGEYNLYFGLESYMGSESYEGYIVEWRVR